MAEPQGRGKARRDQKGIIQVREVRLPRGSRDSGGFVFTTVHNIQPDVPPENIMAMWEALQEYGVY